MSENNRNGIIRCWGIALYAGRNLKILTLSLPVYWWLSIAMIAKCCHPDVWKCTAPWLQLHYC